MEHYLVDFENVSSAGLEGMAGLGRNSFVYIIYTTSSTKIRLDALENVDCGGFRTIKVRAGKQSLDMHLISYLGYLIGASDNPKEDVFRIISCDRDYDGTAEFWRTRMGYDVKVQKTIGGDNPKPQAEAVEENTEEEQSSSRSRRRRRKHGKRALQEGTAFVETLSVEEAPAEVSEPLAETETDVQTETTTEPKEETPEVVEIAPEAPRKKRDRKRKNKKEDTKVTPEETAPSEAEEAKPEEKQPEPKVERRPMDEEEKAFFEKTLAEKSGRKNLKTAVYRSLVSRFGQERGGEIYKMVKGSIKQE